MDTIDYIIISPKVIANISKVNSEIGITSDHCTMKTTIKPEKIRSEDRNISVKLYYMADLSKKNGNIKKSKVNYLKHLIS